MTHDLVKLRELAVKAEHENPSPWSWSHDDLVNSNDFAEHQADHVSTYYDPIIQTDSGVYGPRDGTKEFISAANPATIIALLDALDAANARVKELEAKLRNSMMIAGKRTDLESTAFAMVHTEKHNPNNPVKVLP